MHRASSSDLALVSRVVGGDSAAAEALVERVRPLIISVVRKRLPQRIDEADLIQVVYLRVFSRLEQYSGKAPLEHWVSRIAVSSCINALRHEKSRPELRRADLSEEQDEILDFLHHSAAELSPDRQLAAKELVTKLLEILPPREHLIITLLYLEGRTLAEIRELTGWTVAALKIRAFRARRKMKKTLQQLMSVGAP